MTDPQANIRLRINFPETVTLPAGAVFELFDEARAPFGRIGIPKKIGKVTVPVGASLILEGLPALLLAVVAARTIAVEFDLSVTAETM